MSKLYSMKQSVAVASLCLVSEFSFGLVSCQDGLDYKNSCDPYAVNFTKVMSNSDSIDNNRIIISQKSKISKSSYHPKSYLDSFLDKHKDIYNRDSSLKSLIDTSIYANLKLKEMVDNKNSIKAKPKPIRVTKVTKKTDIHLEKNKKDDKKTEEIISSNSKKASLPTKIKKDKTTLSKIDKSNIKSSDIVKVSKKKDILVSKDELSIKKVSKNEYKFYTVLKGDNLIKIANKFSIKKDSLIKLNSIEKNNTIKVGQKLKLPVNAKLAKDSIKKSINKDKSVYVVQDGDTLSLIAKKTNKSITKLREINRLSRSGSIKVGQKLYLKQKKFAKRVNRTFDFAKNIKFKKVTTIKYKRKIRVVATAYTSHRNQTDRTPFLAAWNNRIRPGMKIIAVSPDLIRKYGLTNGVKVKIMGLSGYYVVRDKMNARLKNHIDIYMGVNKRRALKWGRKRIVLYW